MRMISRMKVMCVAAVMIVGCAAWAQPGQKARQREPASAKEVQDDRNPEWTAKWIQAPWSTERDGAELDGSTPMPIFRREFVVRAKPVKATLRIAGLGQF